MEETVKMASSQNLHANTSNYYYENENFTSTNISGNKNLFDVDWIPRQTDSSYRESNISSSEGVSVSEILEKCGPQLLELYPSFGNLAEEDKRFAICDYCNLTNRDLNVLYSDLTCVTAVYRPIPLFCVLFGLVFVLGLVGNVLVICGVRTCGRGLSSVMHMFIANVAAADLLIVLFCLPFTVTSMFVLHYWPFGKAICVGASYLQVVSVFASSYSLVAVAIDRYMAIIYPLRPRISRLTAKVAIGIIWILAFITGIPAAYNSKLVKPGEGYYLHHNVSVCQEKWPEEYEEHRKIYSLVLLSLHYFLPVTVMVFTYTRIAQRVWCSKESKDVRSFKASVQLSYSFYKNVGTLQRQWSSSSTKGGGPNSPPSPTSSGQSPVKLICMTVTVVSVYSLCWLPFNVLMVLQEFDEDIHYMAGFHYLWAGCYFMAMLHAVFNVMLLYWLNPVFHYSVLKLLCKLFPCCRASLEFRLQKLSSYRFKRKYTFTNSTGAVNSTVTVRQSGSLQRRYHRTPSNRSNSVTRTLSTRTVEESISLTSTPRVSNNPGVSSPNDLATLHEMSSDAISDKDGNNVFIASHLTVPAGTSNRRSAEAGHPLLVRTRDTVTTDEDCRSEMGDRGNRGTFSDTDEVFLPDQEEDFIESADVSTPGRHSPVSHNSRVSNEELEVLNEVLRDAEPVDGCRNHNFPRQEGSDACSEYEFDKCQSHGSQFCSSNDLQADGINQREVSLKNRYPEEEEIQPLSGECVEEELILPDMMQLRTLQKLNRGKSTDKTTFIPQDNLRHVTKTEEVELNLITNAVELQPLTDLSRSDPTRFTFVLQREQLCENADDVEL